MMGMVTGMNLQFLNKVLQAGMCVFVCAHTCTQVCLYHVCGTWPTSLDIV